MTNFDWKNATRDAQLSRARNANKDELNAIMRSYKWSQHPEVVLGWVSAQKEISLSAALSGFFNGDPWRFNYLPKRDVTDDFRGAASLLDSICQRLNAGFYLPDAEMPCQRSMGRLNTWVENQKRDRRGHRRGRWVINAETLEPLLAAQREAFEKTLRGELTYQIASPKQKPRLSLKRFVSPLAG